MIHLLLKQLTSGPPPRKPFFFGCKMASHGAHRTVEIQLQEEEEALLQAAAATGVFFIIEVGL